MTRSEARPSVVVFDLDGTLLDSVDFHHRALIAAYASLGLHLGARPLSQFPHYTDSAIFSQLIEESRGEPASPEDLELLDARLHGEYTRRRLSSSVGPIAGARELLRALDQDPRFEIGFATGAMRRASLAKLRLLEVDADSALITTASEFLTREQIVADTLRRAAARRAPRVSVVSVGDGVWDQRTAERLGIPFLAVESGSHRFGSGPALRVSDLTPLSPDTLYDLSAELIAPPGDGYGLGAVDRTREGELTPGPRQH